MFSQFRSTTRFPAGSFRFSWERGASIEAVFVVRVPRAYALEGALPEDVRIRAEESLAEARALGEENGVEVVTHTIVARSIGHAIVEEALDVQRETREFYAKFFHYRLTDRELESILTATPP